MTSITLPLKKMPGQRQRLPTFFGGRKITAPAVLLLTTPFNLYLYLRLSQGTPLSYNLVGLLPYVWGLVSIAGYIKKSSRTMETIIEADLDEAEEIFMESRNYFRKLLISNIAFSIILIAIFSIYFITHGGTLLFIIGLSSITSTGIALLSIISMYDWKKTLGYVFLVFVFEFVLLIAVFRGPVELALIFPASSVSMMYMMLRGMETYDLRGFFERLINN